MRRKVGNLTEIETRLMRVAATLEGEFHGWQLAKAQQAADGERRPVAIGTLYRALDNLQRYGHLTSRLEPADVAEAERRPRRRLFTIARGQP